MNRSFWLKNAFKFVFFAALLAGLLGYVTMSLWNYLMPLIFHLPALNFWQALGLLLLSRLLFGGFGRGGQNGWARGRAWKKQMEQRMAAFSPEEREKFRQQMRSRCAGTWGRPAPAAEAPAS